MEEAHCDEVIPGLYVGSLRSLGSVAELGITHVLSAVNFEITRDLGGRPHLLVPLRDDEGDSLLPHLPAAIAFIQEGLQRGGRVLVHCQAGQSRSVALAVAYMMKTQSLGAEEALDLLRVARPMAEPNEGYWSQLLLFQDMRCRLDEDHPVYRLWRLEQVGRRWEEDGCWADGDSFASAPSDKELQALQVPAYRCRKCRMLLLTQQHVVPVEAAMGSRMFRNFWKLRAASGVDGSQPIQQPAAAAQGGGGGGGGDAVSSLFVDPMKWMASAVVGATQGKLYCVRCSARLGSFNWSGISNERGAWVTPAFQLHCSKLDVVQPPALAGSLARVRQPLFGAAAPGPSTAPQPEKAGPGPAASSPEAPAAARAQQPTAAAGPGPGPAALGPELDLIGPGLGSGPGPGEACPEASAASAAPHGAAAAPDTGPAGPGPELGPGAAPPEAHQHAAAESPGGDAPLPPTAPAPPATADLPFTTPDPPLAAAASERDTAAGRPDGPHLLADAPHFSHLPAVPHFSHLILDCDGVLVDTERASCEALAQAIARVTGFQIPRSFPEDYQPVFGMDVRSCLEYYKRTFDRSCWSDIAALAIEVEEAKAGIYKELTAAGIAAFPSARELILQAQEMGLGVGIASSGAPEKIHHNLSSSGLLGLVDPQYVVSAAHVNRGKPAPDVYLEAMRRLQCERPGPGPGGSSVLVVEDAVNGLMAARAAGAFAVAVPTSLPADSLRPHADAVVASLHDVLLLLQRQAAAAAGRPA